MVEQTTERQGLKEFLEIPLTYCPLMEQIAINLGKRLEGIVYTGDRHGRCHSHLLGYLAQPRAFGHSNRPELEQSARECGNSSVSRAYCGDATMTWLELIEIVYKDKLEKPIST